MGINPVASAVPNYLYDYSDQTIRRIDAAQKQISNLANLIKAYRKTAIEFGHDINYLTVPVSSTGGSDIAERAQRILPGIRALDQQPRDIGAAFEAINREVLKQDDAGVLAVTTDETQIDAYLAVLPSERAGTALAAYANARTGRSPDTIDDHVLQELAAHQNDYAFVTAFLSHLDDLGMLLSTGDLDSWFQPGIPADAAKYTEVIAHVCALAFTHGATPLAVSLADSFEWGSPGDTITNAFLRQLESNPQAAKGFLASLDEYGPTWLAANKPAQFVAVAAAAMSVSQGDEADELYNSVTTAIQSRVTDAGSILDQVEKFVGEYLAVTVPPPPAHATPAQLDAWARASTDYEMKKLSSWHDWLFSAAQQQQGARSAAINWENFGVGVAVSIVTSVVTLNPVVGAGVGVAASAATTWAIQWVNDSVHPDTDDPVGSEIAFRKALAVSLRSIAVAGFLRNGEITDAHGKPTPLSEENIRSVLNSPQSYLIAGTKDVQVNFILNEIGSTILNDE